MIHLGVGKDSVHHNCGIEFSVEQVRGGEVSLGELGTGEVGSLSAAFDEGGAAGVDVVEASL